MMLRMLVGAIVLALAGCGSMGKSQNSTLKKLSLPLIKSFLKQDGCNEIDSTKNLGALPDGDYFGQKLSKEHWRVEGCGKIYDFELSASRDGNHVNIQKL